MSVTNDCFFLLDFGELNESGYKGFLNEKDFPVGRGHQVSISPSFYEQLLCQSVQHDISDAWHRAGVAKFFARRPNLHDKKYCGPQKKIAKFFWLVFVIFEPKTVQFFMFSLQNDAHKRDSAS